MDFGPTNTEQHQALKEVICNMATQILQEIRNYEEGHHKTEKESRDEYLRKAMQDLSLKYTQIQEKLETLTNNELSGSELDSLVCNYAQRLSKFHLDGLQRLMEQKPTIHDVSKYVRLSVCLQASGYETYEGLDEYLIAADLKKGEDIEPENLFKARPHVQERDPRTVLLVGVPGSGKTISCHYFLKECIEADLFR